MFNIVISSGLIILIISVLISQFYFSDLGFNIVKTDAQFRLALSLSPFSSKNIKEGYTYEYNNKQINNIKDLERIYIEKGATEMYVRIATKRRVTPDDITDTIYMEVDKDIENASKIWLEFNIRNQIYKYTLKES